jgi:hypothetical protein
LTVVSVSERANVLEALLDLGVLVAGLDDRRDARVMTLAWKMPGVWRVILRPKTTCMRSG